MTLPTLTMLIGLPGSGKSTYAKNNKTNDTIICSSDNIRKELYGDINDQSHNQEVFTELHKRIKESLRNGQSVIYDATNINGKRRTAFLRELDAIPCRKVADCIAVPYDVCLKRNNKRDRAIPSSVIRRMYLNYQPPWWGEGFDVIAVIYNGIKQSAINYSMDALVRKIEFFDQENSHHSLTLGKHCDKVFDIVFEKSKSVPVRMAAFLHDEGKIFTKSRLNSRGEDDGNCHYYQHHCVGAYNSFFYTRSLDMSAAERIYVANLIYYHMHPFRQWSQSERAKNRDKRHLGIVLYDDIMLLHEADVAAH